MSGARAQAPCPGEGTEAVGPKAVVPTQPATCELTKALSGASTRGPSRSCDLATTDPDNSGSAGTVTTPLTPLESRLATEGSRYGAGQEHGAVVHSRACGLISAAILP